MGPQRTFVLRLEMAWTEQGGKEEGPTTCSLVQLRPPAGLLEEGPMESPAGRGWGWGRRRKGGVSLFV